MKSLLPSLRKALKRVADSRKAPTMQAYMKSSMPYLGVTTPKLRAVCRAQFQDLKLESARAWEEIVRDIWRRAKYREERYAAIHLLEDRRFFPFQKIATLKLIEELIVDGAWWDYVDVIASHRVGYLLATYPRPMRNKMLLWSRSQNLWKRRAAILCQLGFKDRTDLKLLYACIEPSLGSEEFFLQKAIGWALRQYAWTDAKEVQRYVRANHDRLSALSQREALKNVGSRR